MCTLWYGRTLPRYLQTSSVKIISTHSSAWWKLAASCERSVTDTCWLVLWLLSVLPKALGALSPCPVHCADGRCNTHMYVHLLVSTFTVHPKSHILHSDPDVKLASALLQLTARRASSVAWALVHSHILVAVPQHSCHSPAEALRHKPAVEPHTVLA